MKSLPLFTNIFNLTTYIIHPRVSNLHERWIEMNRDKYVQEFLFFPPCHELVDRKYLTSSPYVSTGLFHAALWNAFGIKGWNEGGRVESISPIIIRRSDRVWAGWRFNTTWRWQGDSFPPTAPHDLDFSSSLSLVIKSVTSVGVCVYIYIYIPLPLTSILIEASIKRGARADEAARFDKARILSVLFFRRFYLFIFFFFPVFPLTRSIFIHEKERERERFHSIFSLGKKRKRKEASSDRLFQVRWINFRNGLKVVWESSFYSRVKRD